MKRRIAILSVLGMLPWAGLNSQQTTAFRVTAKVEQFCGVTAPDLALGKYTARSGAAVQATPLLRATCTPNTSYLVGLNTGTSQDATISGKTAGMLAITGVGTGLPVDHTLLGAVPAVQLVPPDDYADTVSVRVYY